MRGEIKGLKFVAKEKNYQDSNKSVLITLLNLHDSSYIRLLNFKPKISIEPAPIKTVLESIQKIQKKILWSSASIRKLQKEEYNLVISLN